jgi:hypothetical protein
MQKLIIEDIQYSDTSTNATLKIRNNTLSMKQMIANIHMMFKGRAIPSYRKGRVAFLTVDLNYIATHNVAIGDDINDYDDIEYRMMLLESTNTDEFENEGIAYNAKMNPSTMEPILYKGKPVYHATFLIPMASYRGDITLT